MVKTVTSNYTSIAAPGNTFNQRISADADIFARNDIDALGNALELHTHASGLGLPVAGLAAGVASANPTTITGGGVVISTGGLTITAGGVGIGGAPVAGSGLLITSGAASDPTNRYSLNAALPSGASNQNIAVVAGPTAPYGSGLSGAAWLGGLVWLGSQGGSPPMPASGDLRIPNNRLIAWRNAANSADVTFGVDGSSQFAFVGTNAASATAGSSGAPPAQVAGYLAVSVNGTAGKFPWYLA